MEFSEIKNSLKGKIPSNYSPLDYGRKFDSEIYFKYYYSRRENTLLRISIIYWEKKNIYIAQILKYKNIYSPEYANRAKFNGCEGMEIYSNYYIRLENGEYNEFNYIPTPVY